MGQEEEPTAWSVRLPDVPSPSAIPQSSVRVQSTCSGAGGLGFSPTSRRGAAFRSVGMAEAARLLLVGGAGGSELYTSTQALGLLFQN